MAFTVQDDQATVDAANAYVDVAAFDAWAADRGIDVSSFSAAEKQQAIVRATDYLDSFYGARYAGYQLRRLQGTLFPRGGVTSWLRGLPPALRQATYSMTNRALNLPAGLMPDPTFDATGQRVLEATDKVGPLETTRKYSEAYTSGQLAREYPEITKMLQGADIIGSSNSGQLLRG